MKKQFIIGLVLLIASIAGAQAQGVPGVRFGIRAGLNAATWNGEAAGSARDLLNLTDGQLQQRSRQGFHAGVYANIPVITDRLEIEPGILYSQKGTRLSGQVAAENLPFLSGRATITNRAEYIDVPVIARVFIADGFHVYAGPQVSFLVANTMHTDVSVLGFSALNRNFNTYDASRKIDVAAVGGVGYRFANGINLGAGYDFGFNRIDDGGNFRTFNRVWKFSVGYQF